MTDGGRPPDAPGEPPTVRLDYPAADIRLLATSEFIVRYRARAGAKEPWTIAWIEAELGRGGVFYDIGANVGAYSLVAARQPAPPTVFAFEPGYRNFADLCGNVHLNRCAAHITPVPLALGARSGLGRFRYKTLDAGQSRHTLGPADGKWKDRMQQVPVVALDDLVGLCELPSPTHIKLDVDGAELAVLEGATATLASPALRGLLVEVDDALWEPVLDVVSRAGFVLRSEHRRKPTAPRYAVLDRP